MAGAPLAGATLDVRSAWGAAGLELALGTASGPANLWGAAGPAGAWTPACCCARDALPVHNSRPSATMMQIEARAQRLRTAVLPTALPPSVG